MQPTLCSRCNKNIAVIFVTKMEGENSVSEGLCLKCAKELGIKPVDDLMTKLGISDEELDAMTNEMMGMLSEGGEDLPMLDGEDDGEDADGKTATFPFLNKLFGSMPPQAGAPSDDGAQKASEPAKGEKKQKFKHLDNFCISLTERAKSGALDRIVGREQEIERVIQILNRRQKNNPCLIGEPGVGKTAIAEGLAIRTFEGNVPHKLRDKEIFLLDLTSLVAGTQFRGQFESRMKGLIEDIKKKGNVILVIDEVHNLVGAGDAEGSMNAANILKPALSRGEIQVIGATTFTEYRKHIEKDSALERRFQTVIVNEPSIDETVDIIRGIAHYYEEYHGVKISDDIARLAVILSERYITDRYLPDKAIDLIDEACSDLNLTSMVIAERAEIDTKLRKIEEERDSLTGDTSENAFERLALLKSDECKLLDRKSALDTEGTPELTDEHLAKVIELWTKIPASAIRETEFRKLSELEARLKKRIVGQDEAVAAVAAAIKRNRVGISPKRKPVSFLFTGSTGVGKTELVKCLAADLFNSPESLIRLDMSEFMEKHAVSKLIGAPPGYVGYDEAGQLTEKIRRKPYSVVLFDEIEKAHPDVLNILLQILDDGRITDAQGREVNFENAVIVMTSNAGSQYKSGTVGFAETATEQNRERVMKALSDFLRPEFINRIDEIVAFNSLTRENFKAIAKIMLSDLTASLAEKQMTLEFDDSLVDYLTEKSYSEKYGARNLRRVIQKELEDVIANLIIENYEKTVKKINVTVKDNALDVRIAE
ncbi:MAG: ATP-dependent Clp protease ATP-binding subunit [Oscillospiraceae bacterium]|nr:ATP-dependent Clp protease ATP-binding subunit [Oscillospiraceae bacterium]